MFYYVCVLHCVGTYDPLRKIHEFWSVLPNATVSDDGRILTLVQDAYFLGSERFRNKLLVRDCYLGLLSSIQDHFEQGGQGVAIIGNPGRFPCCQIDLSNTGHDLFSCSFPGISKSMLSYYRMYRASLRKDRVVFRKAGWKGEMALLFCADGEFTLDEKQFDSELCRPDVLYAPVTVFAHYIQNRVSFLFAALQVYTRWTGYDEIRATRYSKDGFCIFS